MSVRTITDQSLSFLVRQGCGRKLSCPTNFAHVDKWKSPGQSAASGNTCTGRLTAPGHTVDFLLRAHRDRAAARCSFERAIDLHGLPEKATIDKSGANPAAIAGMRAHSLANIQVPQSKYLNLIEQHPRAIKRVVRPMLGFKSIQGAHAIIAGIKTMQLIKKRQLDFVRDRTSYAADTFYFLTS